MDVVLPCLNEAAALPAVLARFPAGFCPLVVDNGSTDGSAEVARAWGARVVGGARPRARAPLRAGEADLVLGRRRPRGRGAWPLHARVANAALATWLRGRSGVAVHDLGPMRMARRTDLLDLGILDRRFGYPLEMLLRAAAAGWRLREVDVGYAPRVGRSKVTGTLAGTLRAVGDMARVLAVVPGRADPP